MTARMIGHEPATPEELEMQRDLDACRTLQDIADCMEKHRLKLSGWQFPGQPRVEVDPQTGEVTEPDEMDDTKKGNQ